MTFLPIADRELRTHARWRATFAMRCFAAGIAFGITANLLMRGGGFWTGRSGHAAFGVITGLTFLFCLYEGLRNTADCLSEEKRAGTMGLLFLTDLPVLA